jgi:hypothetical protein
MDRKVVPRSLGLIIRIFFKLPVSYRVPRVRTEWLGDGQALDLKLSPRSLGIRIIAFPQVVLTFLRPKGWVI